MEILEAFYRRKLKKKQKRSAMFHSEVELNRAPSLASVGAVATSGGAAATGLITRVLHLTRRREPRPHSWHSTKLGEGSSESMEQVDGMSSVHSSAADLLSGLDSGGGGRWSLESLEPAQRLGRPAAAHLGPRSSSSCLQLSSTRSSNLDLHHSNREAAYSSYPSSLSFPEGPDLSGERSFSWETVAQTEDLRSAHALSPEQDSGARVRMREQTGNVGGTCYHGSREDRHSLGPVWGSSCESLKGAPAPQRRSESYTATRPERPSSWSTLEQARTLRSLRSQQRGSWHHSSGSLASAAKGLYAADGQLHTVIEKSPESSPGSRPRQAQSPGAPQESPYLGLYPSWLRDNQSGHHHRVVPYSHMGRSPADPQTPPIPQDSASASAGLLPHPSQPEHPLTRLEMALAEVQGSTVALGETGPAPGPSVSVLEKVSRFEHREWATRQHGLSSRQRSGSKQVIDTSLKTQDLRNAPDRSYSRTLSHTGVSHEQSRPYKDGAKDTQVFRSTSFRCTSSAPTALPPVPPKVLTYLDKGDAKPLPPAEKKGPKTLPKPHGVAFTPRPPPPFPPHTVSPPAPPGPARICGRRRLTSEQKKRSFSEPECMNEIGLAGSDGTALFRHTGDPTVADRRRMFELAARGAGGGAPVQEVQLEHMEKKREGRSQRPFSAVFQPPPTHADSVRLTSSSSLRSLTDCAQEAHLSSGDGPLSSALAPGGHQRTTQSMMFYPGRVTSPRAPAVPPPGCDSSASLGEDEQQPVSESHSPSLSPEVDRPLQTCASSDAQLDSTPAGDAVEQGVNTSSGITLEEEGFTVDANRAALEASEPDSPLPHVPKAGAPQAAPALLSGSAPRRERSRRSSRSALAASVGLPCPLSHTPSPTEHQPSEGRDERSGESEPNWQLQKPTGRAQDKDRSEDSSSSPTAALQASGAEAQAGDRPVLEYEPVPVRLPSPEERRVQALVRTLVRSDRTLAPLMDMWGKSTVDVLKDIFPDSRLVEKLPQQHSDPLDDWGPEPAVESPEPSVDLITRKVELCEALRKCIESLQREKEALSDAFRAHTELGKRVEAWVRELCEDGEREKYNMFIGDLERVVNLLLSLCGRLARIERSLASQRRQGPEEGSTELWDSLAHKRTLLLRQTQEALELRDHLERRQCAVHAFLRRRLAPAQLRQYGRLVRSTPALLVGLRRLDDLRRQAQETLSLLLDTVPLEVTQARGWSRVGLALSAAAPPLLMHTQAPPTWHSGPARLDCPVTVTPL